MVAGNGGRPDALAGRHAGPEVLGSCGDDHRIDWGYACVAATSGHSKGAIGAVRS